MDHVHPSKDESPSIRSSLPMIERILDDDLSLLVSRPRDEKSLRIPLSKLGSLSRQLVRHLKALQIDIQQNRLSPMTEPQLVPCLLRLLTCGLAADVNEARSRWSMAAESVEEESGRGDGARCGEVSPTKYATLHVRWSQEPGMGSISSDSSDADRGGETRWRHRCMEEGGGDHQKRTSGGTPGSTWSKVRSLSLSCMQTAAKSNPKALHSYWTALLPDADDRFGDDPSALNWTSSRDQSMHPSFSLATFLVSDPCPKVRQAAANALATLFEGPAQRAYLAIAEWTEQSGTTTRAFIPLSYSLGRAIVGTHNALIYALLHEEELGIVASELRALGTLLVGTPYARLPEDVLVRCVDAAWKTLRRLSSCPEPAYSRLDSALEIVNLSRWEHCTVGTPLSIMTAGLDCLAAAFGVKPSSLSLKRFLDSDRQSESTTKEEDCDFKQNERLAFRCQELVLDLLECASLHSFAVQLEAIMALRGLVQQYVSGLEAKWEDVLALFSHMYDNVYEEPNLPGTSPRSHQDGTLQEKVAQQCILLIGDIVCRLLDTCKIDKVDLHLGGKSDGLTGNSLFQDAVKRCFVPVLRHRSAILRTAGLAALSLTIGKGMHVWDGSEGEGKLNEITSLICSSIIQDSQSPVRAAACKALTSLLRQEQGIGFAEGANERVLSALVSSCHDDILAVRIHGANALGAAGEAFLCSMVASCSSLQDADDATWGRFQDVATQLALLTLKIFGDHEKVQPMACRSAAFCIISMLKLSNLGVVPHRQKMLTMVVDLVGALSTCLSTKSNVKVQWSACEAAKRIFNDACSMTYLMSDSTLEALHAKLVSGLHAIHQHSTNAKARTMASEALECVCNVNDGDR